MTIAYLNGEFLPLADAKISVLDRGFIFGDGVYEVAPVYRRRPFFLGAHLRRLAASLAEVQIAPPMENAQWRQKILSLVSRQNFDDQSLYLQVTRGVAPRKHTFPDAAKPTVFMMCMPLPDNSDKGKNGVAVATADDFRWTRCHIKSTSLLGNVILAQNAAERNCEEIILFRGDFLAEASASNVFIVAGKKVMTPPADNLILHGITRKIILECASQCGIAVEERPIRRPEFAAADEIWITSSTREILPVVRLDGVQVGDGKPGAIFRRIHQAVQSLKNSDPLPDDFPHAKNC